MESVVLRPSIFMEVWLGPHLGFDIANAKARIYGDGTAKVSYVSGPTWRLCGGSRNAAR